MTTTTGDVLKKSREGEVFDEFSTQPESTVVSTLGSPDQIIWSSLLRLRASEVADEIILRRHKIQKKVIRKKIARAFRVYIEQANAMYTSATAAPVRSAPLLYYYSFLNLAKALVSITYPVFHKEPANYHHGISWKPNPKFMVDLSSETVIVDSDRRKGVWHILWEYCIKRKYVSKGRQRLKVLDLFACCPEIESQFEQVFGIPSRIIKLNLPRLKADRRQRKIWIDFGVSLDQFLRNRVNVKAFSKMISKYGDAYEQVMGEDGGVINFQSKTVKAYAGIVPDTSLFEKEIRAFNLFTTLSSGNIEYFVTLQQKLPKIMPQIMVLYTLVFWLGSLVRYDPYSVEELERSGDWVLIEGFINESRIWLLELFEWEFYKNQTALLSAR